jgi:hypothetical protein
MERDLAILDALPPSDFDEAEAFGYEIDVIVGGLGPAPGSSDLEAEELTEESFDAHILAGLLNAR